MRNWMLWTIALVSLSVAFLVSWAIPGAASLLRLKDGHGRASLDTGEHMSRIRKTIAAAIAALGTIGSFLADGEVSQNDITGIAAAVLGVVLVWATPNVPEGGA